MNDTFIYFAVMLYFYHKRLSYYEAHYIATIHLVQHIYKNYDYINANITITEVKIFWIFVINPLDVYLYRLHISHRTNHDVAFGNKGHTRGEG